MLLEHRVRAQEQKELRVEQGRMKKTGVSSLSDESLSIAKKKFFEVDQDGSGEFNFL